MGARCRFFLFFGCYFRFCVGLVDALLDVLVCPWMLVWSGGALEYFVWVSCEEHEKYGVSGWVCIVY